MTQEEKLEKVISTLPQTKAEQDQVVESFVSQVMLGFVDPIDAELAMVAMENIVKNYRKNADIRKMLIDKVEEQGGKLKTANATISIAETAVEYSYEDSKMWRDIDREYDSIKAKKAEIETALKNSSELAPFIDSDGTAIKGLTKCGRKTIKVLINKE